MLVSFLTIIVGQYSTCWEYPLRFFTYYLIPCVLQRFSINYHLDIAAIFSNSCGNSAIYPSTLTIICIYIQINLIISNITVHYWRAYRKSDGMWSCFEQFVEAFLHINVIYVLGHHKHRGVSETLTFWKIKRFLNI